MELVSQHKCWGCLEPVQDCGDMCIDCLWERHLDSIAHTNVFEEVHENTPQCCVITFNRRELELDQGGSNEAA